jgi:hemolysin activation/secretion protein
MTLRWRAAVPMTFVLLFAAGRAGAAETVPAEAADQLVSQAEAFREREAGVSLPSDEAPQISLEEDKPLPDEGDGPSFRVRTIYFEGNTIVPETAFRRYVEPFENQKTSFAHLKEFTQIVTNHYRGLGYTTSRAYLPPQTVQDETVTVKVIEGKIGKIHVEGNKHFSDSFYRDSIRLRKDRVFRYQDLESSLYFLNQQPDRKAKAFLIAGTEPTTSDIILKAEDSSPFHASYEFNNRGTVLTHRARHVTTLTNGDFLGHGDSLTGSFSMAEEGAFDAVSGGYAYPLLSTDTLLTMDASYADTMIVKHLKSLEIKNESRTVTPGILQTIHREPSFVADVYAGFEIKDSKTLVDDEKVSFERMRVLRTGPRLTFQDRDSRMTVALDAHAGVPGVLGGSSEGDVNLARRGSSGQFVYYTANWTRIQKAPWSSYLTLRAGGQYAFDTLPSLEQFRAGGAFSVRGYPESDSSGDLGYNLSAELSVPLPAPKEWRVPFSKKRWREAVRLVGFLDAARTYNRERVDETSVKDRFLLGTGVGVRMNLDRTFSLQCDLGFPIGDESGEKDRPQTHLSVRGGF